jgi:hypothetical protein
MAGSMVYRLPVRDAAEPHMVLFRQAMGRGDEKDHFRQQARRGRHLGSCKGSVAVRLFESLSVSS